MAAAQWAIDLGTTHTRVARWDEAASQPRLVELPAVCLAPGGEDPLEAPRLVPSATHLLPPRGPAGLLGSWPWLDRLALLGRRALIGREALERNRAGEHAAFAPGFKLELAASPLRPLARLGRRSYSARAVARVFVRELLAEVKRVTGQRIREAAFTAPVDAYETYRAEVLTIARSLGIRQPRFVDEPVAAALGYGLGLARERRVLVLDFGGGTLHLVAAALAPRDAEEGQGRVLAKTSRPVGGTAVDSWVLSEVCRRQGYSLPDGGDEEGRFWLRAMLAEARRVKESIFFHGSARFLLAPPDALHAPRPRPAAEALPELTRDELMALLDAHGLYRTLEECLGEVQAQLAGHGLGLDSLDDVLLVGGSSLLPGVYPLFEGRFGRDRVRGWQPFEAVAFGACVFAAGGASPADFVVHDYAFVTHHPVSHEPQYTVIVPTGTRFPTPMDLWKRQLVPTCSLGEPERLFKLVVCEIGRDRGGDRRFQWDTAGQLHKLGGEGGEQVLVVPLNESNPTLGRLDPPHPPGDRRARLEIAFGIDADKWLCATVRDLLTDRLLMRERPVVRLM